MAAVSMSQRIDSERKDLKLGEVKELNLDGCTATEIEGLSDEYSSLQSLSLVKVGLTSLAAMPALPALTKINVAENPISGGLEALSKCSHLASINLSGNKLAAVSDLAPLASLENLTHLELNNCELATLENYRKEVFGVLPNLKFLDGLDQNGQEEGAAAPVETGDESNGVSNGHAAEDAEDDDDDEDEEDEDDDEEEEIGISALQGSKELDDDEEDYVPGEEREDEDIEDDGDEEDDAESDDDDDIDEAEIGRLSGAGVTGPRRATKRPADDTESADASEAKCPAPDAGGDAEEATNGDA